MMAALAFAGIGIILLIVWNCMKGPTGSNSFRRRPACHLKQARARRYVLIAAKILEVITGAKVGPCFFVPGGDEQVFGITDMSHARGRKLHCRFIAAFGGASRADAEHELAPSRPISFPLPASILADVPAVVAEAKKFCRRKPEPVYLKKARPLDGLLRDRPSLTALSGPGPAPTQVHTRRGLSSSDGGWRPAPSKSHSRRVCGRELVNPQPMSALRDGQGDMHLTLQMSAYDPKRTCPRA